MLKAAGQARPGHLAGSFEASQAPNSVRTGRYCTEMVAADEVIEITYGRRTAKGGYWTHLRAAGLMMTHLSHRVRACISDDVPTRHFNLRCPGMRTTAPGSATVRQSVSAHSAGERSGSALPESQRLFGH